MVYWPVFRMPLYFWVLYENLIPYMVVRPTLESWPGATSNSDAHHAYRESLLGHAELKSYDENDLLEPGRAIPSKTLKYHASPSPTHLILLGPKLAYSMPARVFWRSFSTAAMKASHGVMVPCALRAWALTICSPYM